MSRILPLFLLVLSVGTASAQPVVTWHRENMRLRSASVTAGASGWVLDLVTDNDNGTSSLPVSFRRWWHCQVDNLDPTGERLDITVSNSGYGDVILPVWSRSTDGVTFGAWTRMPASATPAVSGSASSGTARHRFTIDTPLGVRAIRIAKWFPYLTTDKDALLARIAGHPSGRVRSITNIGNSWQGRPIQLVELTDPTTPDAGKKRIWIHSAVHPSENTAYFMVEGLIDFLLSGDPEAATLMRSAIVDIVPMANPDGVVLGNYRTNSRSDEIENNWAAPYSNSEREIVALRTKIEQLMGTAAAPGANPIEAILNLHSSHGDVLPFHFRHVANSSFDLVTNRTGVVPSVHALESTWIQALAGRSSFIAQGSTLNSTCGAPTRPFVECMMHDRWSIDPAWTASHAQIMAITLEGTYTRGPNGARWATSDDYRDVGDAIGRAFVDWFGFPPAPIYTASAAMFGSSCGNASLFATISHTAPDQNVANVFFGGANTGAAAILSLGFANRALAPLPSPFSCEIMLNPAATVPIALDPGLTQMRFLVPPISGFVANLHYLTALALPQGLLMQSSNGLELANDW